MLLVFRGTGLSAVSVSVGFLYPLHMSLKTIENCTSLAEEISGENRHRHTEDEIIEKRGEIVGQLRQWSIEEHARSIRREVHRQSRFLDQIGSHSPIYMCSLFQARLLGGVRSVQHSGVSE